MTHDQINWALTVLHFVLLGAQIWFVVQGNKYLREAKRTRNECEAQLARINDLVARAQGYRNMKRVVNQSARYTP